MRHFLLFALWCLLVNGAVGCDDGAPRPAGPSREAVTTRVGSATHTAGLTASPSGRWLAVDAGSAEAAVAKNGRPSGPLNVMIIFLDALRGDMPWQGYKRPIAPNLTKFAEKSVVYPRAYSVSSYTAKCMGAVLSGRYPSTLYRGPRFFTKYSKANVFFPELLQEQGRHTMAIQAHGYFNRRNQLCQGFDIWQIVPGLKWDAETDRNVTGPKMTEMAIELLGDPKNTSKPFLMWLHYMDPHDKYVVHKGVPRFGGRARDLYDGEVYFTDQQVQKLFDFCKKQPWWKKTVVIITGDHGEAFGEHGMYKHAFALWEELTHVPLIIHGPNINPRRIQARRSHIDFAPTVLDLMGVEVPKTMVGKSMVPELYGAEPDNREPILLDLPADIYNPPTRAIIYGDFKLLEDPGPRYKLFNLATDPGEGRDLSKHPKYRDKYKEMKKRFDDAWAKHPYVAPFGGRKLTAGRKANGPKGPPGWVDPDEEKPSK